VIKRFSNDAVKKYWNRGFIVKKFFPVAATHPMKPQLTLDAVPGLRIETNDVPGRPLSLKGTASVDGVPGEFVQDMLLD
jgi:hypothetical protein